MITFGLFMSRNLAILHIAVEESGTIGSDFCVFDNGPFYRTQESLVLPKVLSFSIMLHTPCQSNPGLHFPIL